MQVQTRIIEWDWDHNQRAVAAEDADGIVIGCWVEHHPGPRNGEWDPELWIPVDPTFGGPSAEKRAVQAMYRTVRG